MMSEPIIPLASANTRDTMILGCESKTLYHIFREADERGRAVPIGVRPLALRLRPPTWHTQVYTLAINRGHLLLQAFSIG